MDGYSLNPRRVRMVAWLSCVLILLDGEARAAGLRLGSARVEVTPPLSYQMEGHESRKQGSTGVHDPLFARVVVVKSAETSIAFVACDLVGFVSEAVVQGAREKFGIEHVLISSSHTHGGPSTTIWDSYDVTGPDRTWPSPEKSWYAATEEKLLRAIGEAARQLEPVTLVPALGFVYLGYNRRLVDDAGNTKMLWRNPERNPTHPLDPRIGLMVFRNARGEPRAVIVNYACHAVVLGPDNLQISADWPGAITSRRTWRARRSVSSCKERRATSILITTRPISTKTRRRWCAKPASSWAARSCASPGRFRPPLPPSRRSPA